jgi:hypothetical protein
MAERSFRAALDQGTQAISMQPEQAYCELPQVVALGADRNFRARRMHRPPVVPEVIGHSPSSVPVVDGHREHRAD